MKPIVIFIKETEGKVILDIEDVKKIIEQAYECGKLDGTPMVTPTTVQPTWNPLKNEKIDITC